MMHTFMFRVAAALLSLGLLIASTRYLGADGRGVLSLALTGIGIIGMLSGFMGGSSMVYLLSQRKDRAHRQRIIGIAAVWSIVSSVIGTIFMGLLGIIPQPVIVHVFLLGMLANLLAIFSYALLSIERITYYNRIAFLQVATTLAIFGLWPKLGGRANVGLYLAALYCSYLICLGIASALLGRIKQAPEPIVEKNSSIIDTARQVLGYGMISQAGLVIQFLNYRLSYFFLDHYAGRAAVGIYSVGAILAESLWMFPGSIALVLYARVSSVGESRTVQETTIALSKLSLVVTAAMLIVLLAVPPASLSAIFGKDFIGVSRVILCLSPGIMALSYAMIINHYMAGIGRFRVNTEAAALGLVLTVTGNVLLVPRLGLMGAALAASMAYMAAAVYATSYFIKRSGLKFVELLPGRDDFLRFKSIIT
jgi:O-antigen/teichoic acid export membrane protein